jgi:hypothetical protein
MIADACFGRLFHQSSQATGASSSSSSSSPDGVPHLSRPSLRTSRLVVKPSTIRIVSSGSCPTACHATPRRIYSLVYPRPHLPPVVLSSLALDSAKSFAKPDFFLFFPGACPAPTPLPPAPAPPAPPDPPMPPLPAAPAPPRAVGGDAGRFTPVREGGGG